MLRAHKQRKGCAPATMEVLAEKGGHLLAVFGAERNVCALTLADTEGYVSLRQADGVSLHTIQKELGTLRAALGAHVVFPTVYGSPLVVCNSLYGAVPGHPVLIGRDHWAGVVATAEGDRGARDYLREHPPLEVECGDLATGRDVDTPHALREGLPRG